MDNMKNLKKMWMNSLSCLDNCYVNAALVVILFIYSSELFSNVNSFIGNMYHSAIIRIIVLLLIIFIAPKDTTIAILLAISYIVSLHYKMSNENFVSSAKNNIIKNPSSIIHNQHVGEEHTLLAKQLPMQHSNMNNNMPQKNNVPLPNKQDQMVPPSNIPSSKNPKREIMKHLKNVESFSSQNMHQKKEHFFPLNSTGLTPNDFNVNLEKEHFFPMMNSNEDSQFNVKVQQNQMPSQVSNSDLTKNECLNNYTPRFEAVGDICSPTATFQNELNAQGLNFPEGFDAAGMGSPLNSSN